MGQCSTVRERAQAVTWQTLEEYVRGQVQRWVQELLEEEVTELLGGASRSAGRRWTVLPAIATGMAGRGV